MKCIEKLKIEHPSCVGENFIGKCEGCPTMYGYKPKDMACPGPSEMHCRNCWEAEVEEYTLIKFIRTHSDEEVFRYLKDYSYNNDIVNALKDKIELGKPVEPESLVAPGDIVWVVQATGDILREKVRSVCFFEDDYGFSTWNNLSFMKEDIPGRVFLSKEKAMEQLKDVKRED